MYPGCLAVGDNGMADGVLTAAGRKLIGDGNDRLARSRRALAALPGFAAAAAGADAVLESAPVPFATGSRRAVCRDEQSRLPPGLPSRECLEIANELPRDLDDDADVAAADRQVAGSLWVSHPIPDFDGRVQVFPALAPEAGERGSMQTANDDAVADVDALEDGRAGVGTCVQVAQLPALAVALGLCDMAQGVGEAVEQRAEATDQGAPLRILRLAQGEGRDRQLEIGFQHLAELDGSALLRARQGGLIHPGLLPTTDGIENLA